MKYPKEYLNKILYGDCLEYMKDIPNYSIDLILTDPPYGIKIAKNGFIGGNNLGKAKDYGFQPWDLEPLDKKYFDEMFRVSKNQIIFGGNYYIEYLYNSSCWIIWDKDNSGNFADCEMAWTSFNTGVTKFKWRWNGMLQEDMNLKEKRYHPTQKPLPLIRKILEKYTQEDDIVLDPFVGSGTTCIACKQLNRKFIGIERKKEYYDISLERLKNNPDRIEKWLET